MHMSYFLLTGLFLLNFCGFFSVSEASSESWTPSSLLIKKLRTAIDVSSKWAHSKPLTFYTPLLETCLVNQTSCSIKVTLVNKITVATLTGGALGNGLYQFYAYSFSWKACGCSGAYDFTANVIYYNTEYGSYAKALGQPDGITIVTFPITTSGNFSNPKFNGYEDFFKCQMKEHKSVGEIISSHTYIWFVNFPHGGIYHVCRQTYRDDDSGKKTTATIIQLPSDPGVNFISNDQFQIFLKMGDSMGQYSEISSCSKFETYKGIVVYKLLA